MTEQKLIEIIFTYYGKNDLFYSKDRRMEAYKLAKYIKEASDD
jgi:hypothetical protein